MNVKPSKLLSLTNTLYVFNKYLHYIKIIFSFTLICIKQRKASLMFLMNVFFAYLELSKTWRKIIFRQLIIFRLFVWIWLPNTSKEVRMKFFIFPNLRYVHKFILSSFKSYIWKMQEKKSNRLYYYDEILNCNLSYALKSYTEFCIIKLHVCPSSTF